MRCFVEFLSTIVLLSCGIEATATPSVFWGSDPVRPGEATLIVGDDLGSKPQVLWTALKNDRSLKSSETIDFQGRQAEILQSSPESLKVLVPKEFDQGVYKALIKTEKGKTEILLNAPSVYWIQGEAGLAKAYPGQWLRIFGRNISYDPKATLLQIIANNRVVRELSPIKANLWEASFEIPKTIPLGDYTVRLYNGKGDASAWSSALNLEIIAFNAWPDRIFNVRDFGAEGQGDVKDSDAIKAALEAAQDNGGGIVLLPRGHYQIEGTLEIPKFVTLRGERRDWASVFWLDADNPPRALIHGKDHFGVEDLTIYASSHGDVISNIAEKSADDGSLGFVRLQRLTLRASNFYGHLKPEDISQRIAAGESLTEDKHGPADIRLAGTNLIIMDNDIYGSSRAFVLINPISTVVARNKFYNGVHGWYSISGSNGVIFEDNQVTGSDLTATGGGVNTLYGSSHSQNVYFSRNIFSFLNGGDREAMTSDGPGGIYFGQVRPSGPMELSLMNSPNQHKSWEGSGVFILGGKGMGQYARVRKIDNQTVYLDHPFTVPPDETSTVSITVLQRNYLFLDNQFNDTGVAIQYYGSSVNHVAAGNKSERTDGFMNSGRWYRHYQPSWYCQFFDNEITEGNSFRRRPDNSIQYGEAVLGTYGYQKPPNTIPLAFAAVHRRNHLYSNAHLEVIGTYRSTPGVRDVIIENNFVENSSLGLKVDGGVVGLLERGNIFRNVLKPYEGPIPHKHGERVSP